MGAKPKKLISANAILKICPPYCFAGCQNLNRVDLSHNQLPTLPGNCFDDCPNLQVVVLSHNGLTKLPVGFLCGYEWLNHVDLSNNNLTNLPISWFSNICFFGSPRLLKINLSHNQFTKLPSIYHTNEYQWVTTPQKIDASHNPIGSVDLKSVRLNVNVGFRFVSWYLLKKTCARILNLSHTNLTPTQITELCRQAQNVKIVYEQAE